MPLLRFRRFDATETIKRAAFLAVVGFLAWTSADARRDAHDAGRNADHAASQADRNSRENEDLRRALVALATQVAELGGTPVVVLHDDPATEPDERVVIVPGSPTTTTSTTSSPPSPGGSASPGATTTSRTSVSSTTSSTRRPSSSTSSTLTPTTVCVVPSQCIGPLPTIGAGGSAGATTPAPAEALVVGFTTATAVAGHVALRSYRRRHHARTVEP